MLHDVVLLGGILTAVAAVLAARLALVAGRPFVPALGEMFLYEATLLFWAGVLTSAGIRTSRPSRLVPEEVETERRPMGLLMLALSVALALAYRMIEAIT